METVSLNMRRVICTVETVSLNMRRVICDFYALSQAWPGLVLQMQTQEIKPVQGDT